MIAEKFKESFVAAFRPVQHQILSEWADEHRRLPRGASPEPGRWRTSRTPYLKEIMDELSPHSKTQIVSVMKGTQLGITEAANNLIFGVMDQYKGPILMVMPTESVVKKHSKKKITPAIKAMPKINSIIKHSKNRGDGGSMFEKEFIGGALTMGWSNTNATFRSDSIQWLILDDVDGFPDDVDGEGSPIELGKNRTDSFGSKRKIFINSTPTVKGISNIEKEFDDSDQRYFYMPCPECSEMVHFEWGQFRITYEDYQLTDEVCFTCKHCGSLIHEHQKPWMMANGKWIPQNQGHQNAGFHISSFYSPAGWVTWDQIAREFLKALKQMETEGRVTMMKRWKNTRAAMTWEEENTEVNERVFDGRLEPYPAPVPKEVRVITAGADTQDDRIEIEVVGWGDFEESWSIDYKVINGDPKSPDTLRQLDEYLLQSFEVEGGGRMRIHAAAIDRAGHRAKYIDTFCYNKLTRRIYAVFGSPAIDTQPVTTRSTKSKYGGRIFKLGVNYLKNDIHAKVSTNAPGPNYMHYPEKECYSLEYFKQLTGERRRNDGRWEGKRPRVEAWDCRVYSLAALMLSGVKIERLTDRNIKLGVIKEVESKPKQKQKKERIKKGWVDGWK